MLEKPTAPTSPSVVTGVERGRPGVQTCCRFCQNTRCELPRRINSWHLPPPRLRGSSTPAICRYNQPADVHPNFSQGRRFPTLPHWDVLLDATCLEVLLRSSGVLHSWRPSMTRQLYRRRQPAGALEGEIILKVAGL